MSDPSLTEDSLTAAPIAARSGAGLYFIASLIAQAAALVRYVVLARLLGPEQLGLAATLVVTGSFFELISDTGSDRFLIQDRHGNHETVQKLVQLTWVSRGVAIALCLVLFAIPLSEFYRTPKIAVGFAWLALSPLILGFTHLDIRRAQRDHNFRTEAVCMLAAETVSLTATATAAWLTHSFTAILYGLIGRALTMVAVSHLIAKRPYRLGWSREHGPRLVKFAAPLMLSGLVLFIGSQGDRIVVARQIGMVAAGQYAAVILLIIYPTAIVMRYTHAIFLPMVAAARDDAARRDRVSDQLGGQTIVLGVVMAVGFAIVAPPVVTLLYGARYTQAPLLVGLIGILQATRFLINWPTTVALSLGRSRTVLVSNLTRLCVFPGAFVGYRLVGGLAGVVSGFIAGEVISIAASLILLNRALSRPRLAEFDRFCLFLLVAAAIIGWNVALPHGSIFGVVGMLTLSVALAAWLAWREWRTLKEGVAFGQTVVRQWLSRRSTIR